MPVDRGVLLEPDPFGRVRRRGGAKPVDREPFERRFSRDLQRIHAQVERRLLQQTLRQREQGAFVAAGAQALDRPIEQRAREAGHFPMRVTTWSERVPSVSTTKTRTGRKSRSAANQMSVALSSGPSRTLAMCSVCISPAGVASFSVPTTLKRKGVNPRPSARVTSYSLPWGGTKAKL